MEQKGGPGMRMPGGFGMAELNGKVYSFEEKFEMS